MAKAKKPTNWRLYAKMLAGFTLVCVGGPAFTMWLTPTEEELFRKYNPDLQRRSLEGRMQRQEEFDEFVKKLKEQSKSEKSIWFVQAEAEKVEQESKLQEQIKQLQEKRRLDEMRIAEADSSRREAMARELAGKR